MPSLFPVVGITEVLFYITKLKVINSISNILLFICFIVFGGFIFIVYGLAPLDAIKATPDILLNLIVISSIAFVIYLAVRILWIIKK